MESMLKEAEEKEIMMQEEMWVSVRVCRLWPIRCIVSVFSKTLAIHNTWISLLEYSFGHVFSTHFLLSSLVLVHLLHYLPALQRHLTQGLCAKRIWTCTRKSGNETSSMSTDWRIWKKSCAENGHGVWRPNRTMSDCGAGWQVWELLCNSCAYLVKQLNLLVRILDLIHSISGTILLCPKADLLVLFCLMSKLHPDIRERHQKSNWILIWPLFQVNRQYLWWLYNYSPSWVSRQIPIVGQWRVEWHECTQQLYLLLTMVGILHKKVSVLFIFTQQLLIDDYLLSARGNPPSFYFGADVILSFARLKFYFFNPES